MRHLVGIVLAIVAAVVIFFAGGWGYLKLLRAPSSSGALVTLLAGGGSLLHNHNAVVATAALLAVGLVAGLLIAIPWVSPLAAGLPGLALLALTGVYLASVRRAVHLIPLKTHIYGQGFEAMLFDGVLALAGLAMVIPLLRPVALGAAGRTLPRRAALRSGKAALHRTLHPRGPRFRPFRYGSAFQGGRKGRGSRRLPRDPTTRSWSCPRP